MNLPHYNRETHKNVRQEKPGLGDEIEHIASLIAEKTKEASDGVHHKTIEIKDGIRDEFFEIKEKVTDNLDENTSSARNDQKYDVPEDDGLGQSPKGVFLDVENALNGMVQEQLDELKKLGEDTRKQVQETMSETQSKVADAVSVEAETANEKMNQNRSFFANNLDDTADVVKPSEGPDEKSFHAKKETSVIEVQPTKDAKPQMDRDVPKKDDLFVS